MFLHSRVELAGDGFPATGKIMIILLFSLLTGISIIGFDIAKFINKHEKPSKLCSPIKAFCLSFTFMLGCIYLQNHINKIHQK